MVQKMKRLKIGSLFAGIGGFELGIERAIPSAETIWQVEKDKYCQSILKKHWPNAKIYDDVRNITKHNVEPVDILIGGFPCQSISVAGKKEGLQNEEKSGLWWEMWRIIGELRPRIVVMENVPNVLRLGGLHILGSLAEIGYDAEWTVISARQFGAPHRRKRWFCVAYPNGEQLVTMHSGSGTKRSEETTPPRTLDTMDEIIGIGNIANATKSSIQKHTVDARGMESERRPKRRTRQTSWIHETNYWKGCAPQSPFCNLADGIPDRVARLKALGNAIVPQCSQYIGECIVRSGLLDDI